MHLPLHINTTDLLPTSSPPESIEWFIEDQALLLSYETVWLGSSPPPSPLPGSICGLEGSFNCDYL